LSDLCIIAQFRPTLFLKSVVIDEIRMLESEGLLCVKIFGKLDAHFPKLEIYQMVLSLVGYSFPLFAKLKPF